MLLNKVIFIICLTSVDVPRPDDLVISVNIPLGLEDQLDVDIVKDDDLKNKQPT